MNSYQNHEFIPPGRKTNRISFVRKAKKQKPKFCQTLCKNCGAIRDIICKYFRISHANYDLRFLLFSIVIESLPLQKFIVSSQWSLRCDCHSFSFPGYFCNNRLTVSMLDIVLIVIKYRDKMFWKLHRLVGKVHHRKKSKIERDIHSHHLSHNVFSYLL
jgi:hypothetical protein